MSHDELVEFIWEQLDELDEGYDESDVACLVVPDGVANDEWNAAVEEVKALL